MVNGIEANTKSTNLCFRLFLGSFQRVTNALNRLEICLGEYGVVVYQQCYIASYHEEFA